MQWAHHDLVVSHVLSVMWGSPIMLGVLLAPYRSFIHSFIHFILFSINILQVDKPGYGNGHYEYRVRIHQLYVQNCMKLSLKSITTIN
jgi:hypothetical protein